MARSTSLRSMAALCLALACTAVACKSTRTVRIAWNAAADAPTGYRILVDGQAVMDIPPPPLDPSCFCPTAQVPVPPGQHTLTIIAYNQFGQSAPSAITIVK